MVACWASWSFISSKDGTSSAEPPAADCCSTIASYWAFSSSSLGSAMSASCSMKVVIANCEAASWRTCSAEMPCCSRALTTSSPEPRPLCFAISSRVVSMSLSVALMPASSAPWRSSSLFTSCSATWVFSCSSSGACPPACCCIAICWYWDW